MSANKRKQEGKGRLRRKKVAASLEPAAPVQAKPERPAPQPSPDFERELQEHFSAEARKKVEQETEHIFGTVLARYGWVRNEHGQVEYIGGDAR